MRKNIHITPTPTPLPPKKTQKIKDFGGCGTLLYIFPRETRCSIHPVTTIAANM